MERRDLTDGVLSDGDVEGVPGGRRRPQARPMGLTQPLRVPHAPLSPAGTRSDGLVWLVKALLDAAAPAEGGAS